MRELYYDLLRMSAVALGLDEDFFVSHVLRGPHTFNINRYPPLSVTGPAKEGQFRVAPHTDWGILTILDRQPGYGGLQVQATDGTWADAPYVPDAFTVNVADLLSRWTGESWRSTRHRVLPPPEQAPDEELISLIVFLEAEVDTVIKPVDRQPGTGAGGGGRMAPVPRGQRDRLTLTSEAVSLDVRCRARAPRCRRLDQGEHRDRGDQAEPRGHEVREVEAVGERVVHHRGQRRRPGDHRPGLAAAQRPARPGPATRVSPAWKTSPSTAMPNA